QPPRQLRADDPTGRLRGHLGERADDPLLEPARPRDLPVPHARRPPGHLPHAHPGGPPPRRRRPGGDLLARAVAHPPRSPRPRPPLAGRPPPREPLPRLPRLHGRLSRHAGRPGGPGRPPPQGPRPRLLRLSLPEDPSRSGRPPVPPGGPPLD